MPAVYRPLAAALWMTGAIAAFTAMAVATREIRGVHDTFEILAYRSVVGFGLVIAGAALLGQLGRIKAQRLGGHAVRNVFHFTGQSLWFWAITMIPLAQVFALEFTSPIWVILLSPLVLGERLTPRKILSAALGLAGVWIVAQPDFTAVDPGVLAAVLADGTITLPDRTTLPWLAMIGVAGVTAHLCLTTALSLAPASSVVPVDFARLPLIALIGAIFYAEPVEISLFLGAGLIFLGIWVNFGSATSVQLGPDVTKL
jgi:drug/metabolite transporter (DMT)-like permease